MKKPSYEFESIKIKISRIFVVTYLLLYLLIIILGTLTAFIYQSLGYTIAFIVIIFILSIIMISVLFITDHMLSPLKTINDSIQRLSQFSYYKKKEFSEIEEYNNLYTNIKNLSDILEETKLNYEKYRLRINKLNESKEKIEIQEKDLIYSISHELKTPISIIETASYAILDGIYEGDEAKKELEIIIEQCKISIKMIQNVLNVFKLSRQDFETQKETYSLSDQVELKIKDFSDMIKKFNHKLIVNIEPDTMIYAIKDQINTVLSNSIQNAITYSPQNSEIIINVKKIGHDSIFEVTNTSVTIPQDKLAHIFEPFTKVDESHTKKNYTGNGLGLYINKQILTKLNFDYGLINVENGVKFFFVGHNIKG